MQDILGKGRPDRISVVWHSTSTKICSDSIRFRGTTTWIPKRNVICHNNHHAHEVQRNCLLHRSANISSRSNLHLIFTRKKTLWNKDATNSNCWNEWQGTGLQTYVWKRLETCGMAKEEEWPTHRCLKGYDGCIRDCTSC